MAQTLNLLRAVIDAADATLPQGGIDYDAIDGAAHAVRAAIQTGADLPEALWLVMQWQDAEDAVDARCGTDDVNWHLWDEAVAACRDTLQVVVGE